VKQILLSALLLACASVTAAAAVRIVEPDRDEILYGRTRIAVEVDDPASVKRVTVHLDVFPEPICRIDDPPYVCFFDAGTSFQGRRVRAKAYGAGGTLLGEHTIETLAFPAPERVVRRTLTVPVVATRKDGESVDLDLDLLDCFYAGRECRPVSATRLVETKRFPVSLELLIDVSGSVDVRRPELMEAIEYVIDSSPIGVEIATTEFAGTYSRLVPFTSDREALCEGMKRLGAGGFATCLVSAMRNSLFALQSLPGHRVLFVITDGEENCRRNARDGLAYMDTLWDIITVSREIGAPVYLYSFNDNPMLPRSNFAKSYEGVARETGGRLFAQGTIQTLPSALEELVGDLRSTWLVDLDLPVIARPDWQRRLSIEIDDEHGIQVRFPEYWEAENREDALRAMLLEGDDATRHFAASRLRSNRNPEILAALVKSLRREPLEVVAREQATALWEMIAGLLLHGDLDAQRAAVKAAEDLKEIEPSALGPLQPALRVYPKTGAPPKLVERLQRCCAP
jgi:Mg-chelatase subunit ChlD